MKKLKFRAVIGLRIVVMIVPVLVWGVTDVISSYSHSACEWLSDKLPNPNKYR